MLKHNDFEKPDQEVDNPVLDLGLLFFIWFVMLGFYFAGYYTVVLVHFLIKGWL